MVRGAQTEADRSLPFTPRQMEQLADMIADRLATRLPTSSLPRLLSRAELADALGVSLSHIENKLKDGTITPVRVGARVLFDYAATVSELREQSRQA